MSSNVIIELKNIHKSFGGVKALKGVDFTLKQKEIHAIVGENGAGKSTLMNIIGGNLQPDIGDIFLMGKLITLSSSLDAMNNGITFIHQELSLFLNMDIITNIFIDDLAGRKNFSLINKKTYRKKALDILKKIKLDIDIDTELSSLGMGQRQMIEISRVLTRETKILVLDEPTSSLTGNEIKVLFRLIRDLSKKGVSIIYISHKLEEVFKIAQKITVLKDGCLVGTYSADSLNHNKLIELMIGHKILKRFPTKKHTIREKPILEVFDFCLKNKFSDINITVKRGEVLGITGLLGAGKTELGRTIFGLDKRNRGDLIINGKKIKYFSPHNLIKFGMGFVTENRVEEGLVNNADVKSNMILASLDNYRKWKIFFNQRKQENKVRYMTKKMNIVIDNIDQPVNSLSGGNQQKIVLSKWILNDPDIIILDEPTHGIDVGAKYEIYKLIDDIANRGSAIIFISSEIPEILGVCDRVLIMYEGKILKEIKTSNTNQQELMLMIQGQTI